MPCRHDENDGAAVAAWQAAQSPVAAEIATAWSNETPAGRDALVLLSAPCGREFAWQSMHDVGCACPALLSEPWYWTVPPPLPLAQLTLLLSATRWQIPQLLETMRALVGAPPIQPTASCRISPVEGVRAGLVAAGPTNPIGIASRWQELQDVGCDICMSLSES